MKNTFVGTHLDFVGFATSIACAIHCAFFPFLISSLPFLGLGFLQSTWIENGIILLSLLLALYPMSQGYLKYHHKKLPILIVSLGFAIIACGILWSPEDLEFIITPIGAILIGLAHYLNWRNINSRNKYAECNIHKS